MPTILDTNRVQRTTDEMVSDTREILHTATSYQDDGVLLEIVADTGNIGRHLNAVCQPDTRNFP